VKPVETKRRQSRHPPLEVTQHQEQVRDIGTGKLRPVFNQPPIFSSAGAGWREVRLEHHRIGEFKQTGFSLVNHCVVLQLAQPIELDWEVDGRPAPPIISVGAVSLLPAGIPVTSRSRHGGEFISVSLTPQFLLSVVGSMTGGAVPEIAPQLGVADDFVRALILQLRHEAEDRAGNRLYAETLATSLASHLVRHYSRVPEPWRDSGGLPRPALRRVIEFINDKLQDPLTLKDLAQIAGQSPWHFARGFKLATGIAPHAFVLRLRLHRAQDLLRCRELTLAEVAVATGFCDASHLARHFRRTFGRAPAAWRREWVR
jgi:AraC family transcriptional regulator